MVTTHILMIQVIIIVVTVTVVVYYITQRQLVLEVHLNNALSF